MTISYRSPLLIALLVLMMLAPACAQQYKSHAVQDDVPAQSSEKSFDDMTDEEADAWLAAQDGKVALNFENDTAIRVEYADTPQERQLGLMYRKSLCEDCGMLFKFDYDRIGSIWMKNTFLPLDLAYITSDGTIVDIFQLQPHDLTPVRSTAKVLFALEMNQGWFAKKDIRVGTKVSDLP